jgi:hypothetical protein
VFLVRITQIPGGRDGLAKPVGNTITRYHLFRHDQPELVEGDELERMLRIHTPFEIGTDDYAALPPLARAITRRIRGGQQDIPDEIEAQVVGEMIGDKAHQVIWVAYPPFVPLADELITGLPVHFFHDVPPGKLLEFVLAPITERFSSTTL